MDCAFTMKQVLWDRVSCLTTPSLLIVFSGP